ncbi:hypothetical protein VC83_03268 [Pseudogymnoascus destructans]|uniref:Zn(2)-C6 fungal-type domain-containing protein n=1 Tax=Pseudogymnoascus destructans TaxID=655981 RepID=A0A177AE51_9PEZI|nr:uncharacterized protein VC83_03268 [Pseudogymnoascus destructans]OAF60389.1 hypothetical protein VC83_03268 [Pseudogymnoascus destructans]
MPVPTPYGALSAAFRVLCLRCLRAKACGIPSHDCVWSAASSKCGYCTAQHSACVPLPWLLGEEFAALRAAEEATPLIPANVAATATEANWVTLLAAQSIPKFCSEAECDLYEEARATRAALKSGLAVSRPLLRGGTRHSGCPQVGACSNSVVAVPSADGTGERPGSLGELVDAVGKLPTTAVPAVVPTRGDGRKEGGEDGEVGAAYGA